MVQGRHDRGLAALLPSGDHLRFAAPVRRVERDGDVTRTAIEYGVECHRAVVEMDLSLAVSRPVSRGDLGGREGMRPPIPIHHDCVQSLEDASGRADVQAEFEIDPDVVPSILAKTSLLSILAPGDQNGFAVELRGSGLGTRRADETRENSDQPDDRSSHAPLSLCRNERYASSSGWR